MCGICGIFGKKDELTLKKMLSVINHRGPDDEFLIHGEKYCLGVKRLSIIDLEHGRQPLSNEDEKIWGAQNGEIYNFLDLRKLLVNNHKFKTFCDTEVIVHLYEQFGESFLDKLNGMFALAIWDDVDNIGILARDRIGEKPLYYYYADECLYFASEIKCLLKIPHLKRKINFEAVHHYLSYKSVPNPLSIFEGIFQLPPGASLKYDRKKQISIKKYWTANFKPEKHLSETEISDKIIVLLIDSIKHRLISDVPLGFFLSGGVDSSLITALASEISPEPIHTFSLIYPEEISSEGKKSDMHYARVISKKYDTIHHEKCINANDFVREFPKIIEHFDEPFSGAFSSYFLSQHTSKYVKVALSGDGADELFGSYLSHRLAQPIARLLQHGDVDISQLSLGNIKKIGDLRVFSEINDWKWRYKLLVFRDNEKKELYSKKGLESSKQFDTLKDLKRYFSKLTAEDPLNRILEAEFTSFFPDVLLTLADRLSMAHSLEIRTPYLDPHFVDFAAKIPGNLKINNGITKYILKKAALRYLPEDLVIREKEGFIMPFHIWLHDDLENYVRSVLTQDRLNIHGYFNYDYIEKILDAYFNDGQENTNKILTLMAFQIWYEKYMIN